MDEEDLQHVLDNPVHESSPAPTAVHEKYL